VEQQPLGDWSFGALVLLYLSQSDLRPAQEVWREVKREGERGRDRVRDENTHLEHAVRGPGASPSGENWSRSNTVTHKTSCSRSFIKN